MHVCSCLTGVLHDGRAPPHTATTITHPRTRAGAADAGTAAIALSPSLTLTHTHTILTHAPHPCAALTRRQDRWEPLGVLDRRHTDQHPNLRICYMLLNRGACVALRCVVCLPVCNLTRLPRGPLMRSCALIAHRTTPTPTTPCNAPPSFFSALLPRA